MGVNHNWLSHKIWTQSDRKLPKREISPKLEVFFTKLRLRSFRYKSTQSGECPHCNITQNVEHILLNCWHPDMVNNRKMFVEK